MLTHVVTGASGALGAAIATHLVGHGDAVALVGTSRSAFQLLALAKQLGPNALAIPGDLEDPASWSAALAQIEAALGPVGGAVLVAGAWRGGAPLHAEQGDATWRAMLDANLETAHRALAALLPGMVARKQGSIVVVASRAAVRPE
jgi:NADP-dependent 3-hydroxy acid dehydrogenase YdfG